MMPGVGLMALSKFYHTVARAFLMSTKQTTQQQDHPTGGRQLEHGT